MSTPSVSVMELAEPYMREVLGTVGLDVEYVRAHGNTLYFKDETGAEVAVLDLACGFGSLMLGHNNPEIVNHLKGLLDAQLPVHAQFSRHSYANELASELTRIINRETGGSEPYYAIFASTGAEAVEISVKHAELDRGIRLAELLAEIDSGIAQARSAVADGTATVPAEVFRALELEPEPGAAGFDRIAQEVARRNARIAQLPPVFLALTGGFHGKLVASVQLTHNEGYRTPFTRLAAPTRFISVGDKDGLAQAIEAERVELFDLVLSGSTVGLATRPMPIFGGFFVEPIQGEAGIRVLPADFGAEIARVCEEVGCPLIVDEIQSGMGRSGSFLASSRIGLRGDYYLLAKSLAGGVTKSSVMLVREGRYRRDFELVHSSTFAKDALSCHVGLKVLQMLEADDGAAYRAAQQRGGALKACLTAIGEDFPDVVLDVRGEGLMLGLEFRDQADSPSEQIAELARSGFFGFAVAGYALRAHRLRLFQTASAMNTFRFEPSIYLSDAELKQIDTGLRDICLLLRKQDAARLTGS